MSGPTVLVAGADGVLGSTVASVFAEAGWRVLRGTRRKRDLPGSVPFDLARPETLGPAIQVADLTVNTVPDDDLAAEHWAMANGGRVLTLASVPVSAARALRIRAARQRNRGAVVLNAGLAPGVSNLVLADLLARHPESDTIEFVMCLPASGMSGRAGVGCVHENLTTIGRHGVYTKRSPRHHAIRLNLPDPVGATTCFGFAERERAWLLDTVGGRNVHSFAYFDQKLLHDLVVALNPLGLLSEVPRAPFLFGRRSAPAQPSSEPIMHWAAVSARGNRLAERTIECAGGYLHAARAAHVFGSALLDSPLAARLTGCVNPEEIFSLSALDRKFKDVGIDIVDRAEIESLT
ncbi:hypothetical protein ACFVMC_12595 [Nocardia sp. NPDC127579]|uniref:hypothetical protein n=1 Tax=Nocardia sp. NPDC127579 TaxID=3345402 RepID=UPI00362726C4